MAGYLVYSDLLSGEWDLINVGELLIRGIVARYVEGLEIEGVVSSNFLPTEERKSEIFGAWYFSVKEEISWCD